MLNPFDSYAQLPPGPMNPMQQSFNGSSRNLNGPSNLPVFNSMDGLPPMQTMPLSGPPPSNLQKMPPGSMPPNMPLGSMSAGSFPNIPPAGFPNMPPGTFPGPPPTGMPGMPPPLPPSMPPQDSFRGMPGSFQSLPPGGVGRNMSWAPAMPSNQFSSTKFDRSLSPLARGPKGKGKGIDLALHRYQAADATNEKLENNLNEVTNNGWDLFESEQFSALTKAGLQDVDWRVPRVNYCMDTKYDREAPMNGVPPQFTQQVINAKRHDGQILKKMLGVDAIEKWTTKLRPHGLTPPPAEVVLRPGCPFVQVTPDYRREDDIWERQLEVRSLEDAMRGDVTKPLPRPILNAGDFESFHEGRYLKDDCPIA